MLEHRFETSLADTGAVSPQRRDGDPFTFIGERLWLDFVNTDDVRRGVRFDALREFETFVQWLEAANVVDVERAAGLRRRAQQQPSGAAAALVDARRVRASLRALAERGNTTEKARNDTLAEINRILGRSAGTRRLEPNGDGSFTRSFVPVGDAFAGLMIPVVESAADALVIGELSRIRRWAIGQGSPPFVEDIAGWLEKRWIGKPVPAENALHAVRWADGDVVHDMTAMARRRGGNALVSHLRRDVATSHELR
jgi:hypothetical protein